MLRFQLFRIKVYPSRQNLLFNRENYNDRPSILRKTVEQLPSSELWRNAIWKIGNLQQINDATLYFRLGRISHRTEGSYQEGNFIDEDHLSAPYTHVILNWQYEVCAIAPNSKLSRSPSSIAKNLNKLLNQVDTNLSFEVFQIRDPKDFLKYIIQSHKVIKFKMWLSRPNLYDENSDYREPFQQWVEATNADVGTAEIKTKEEQGLKKDILEQMTKATAAAGNDAEATIIPNEGSSSVKKTLRDSSVTFSMDHIDDQMIETLIQAANNLILKYHEVRNAQ